MFYFLRILRIFKIILNYISKMGQALVRKLVKDVPGLFRKIVIHWYSVGISICLHLSK